MFEAQVDEAVDAVLVGEHEEEKDEKQVDEKKDEGSDATPPPAKKARLLEGLRIETRSVHRITGMTYDEEDLKPLEPPPRGDWGWDIGVRDMRQLTMYYLRSGEDTDALIG